MDFTYTHIATEKKSKEALRFYFKAVFSKPLLIAINTFIMILFIFLIVTLKRLDDVYLIVCVAVVIFVLKPLKCYFFWAAFRRAMRHAKIFDTPQEIRLTDTFIEIKRGENVSKNLYSESYTHYLLTPETSVIFLNGRLFAGGLDLNQLEQAGLLKEFLAALEKAGVKRKPYRPWINTCENILRISAIVIFILGILKFFIM